MDIKKLFLLSFVMLFAYGLVSAQETNIIDEGITAEIADIISLDEDVTAEDLDVNDPNLLPDNPFYFLKEWGREIRAAFTFDPVKKAELRERFSNEKLMELKKVAEKNRNANAIKKAARNYQDEVEKVKKATERIRERASENEQVANFLDKFIQHQFLHQRVLQKLESQVPEEAFEKISEVRERHLEKFGEVMVKLEDKKEQLQERLENNLKKVKGSEFKEFKNIEILKELEEKVPEAAKEAIQNVRANALLRLKTTIEQIPTERLEVFKRYTEQIVGTKEKQIEILESLGGALKLKPEIKEILMQTRERILEQIQIQEKAKERINEKTCPEVEKPAANFCKDGRIVIKRDDRGCITSFNCLVPAEVESSNQSSSGACITLWDPVCGKNGKTYSNSCFSKLANTEIAYKGQCKEAECRVDSDCPQPRCGAIGSISARCIGAKASCVDRKCQIISSTQAIPMK